MDQRSAILTVALGVVSIGGAVAAAAAAHRRARVLGRMICKVVGVQV